MNDKEKLLKELKRLTNEPILNLSDVPAMPYWMPNEIREIEMALERIELNWKLFRQNRGA